VDNCKLFSFLLILVYVRTPQKAVTAAAKKGNLAANKLWVILSAYRRD